MNVDQLAGQTDPRDCIQYLTTNTLIKDDTLYRKYASKDKELDLIREAIVHAKCWKRLPAGVITRPDRLLRNHDGVLVFLTEAIPNLPNGKPATLFTFLLQHPERVRDFVIKTLACCKIMVEHRVNHRDLHLNNIMVMPDETVRIIDLGYGFIDSVEMTGGLLDNSLYFDKLISSRDACIFMRSIGLVLHNAFHPYLDMYDRIMRRYARECKTRMELFSSEELSDLPTEFIQPHEEAMLVLFEGGGLEKCMQLDYVLGRFNWETMTPTALLEIHGINVTSI